MPHIFPVSIYYEDTDVTGLVYHPNYFKYFERARSEFFDPALLRTMQEQAGIGVVVYRAEITFKKGAYLGDRLEIHSEPGLQGQFRVVFQQKVFRPRDQATLAEATVELVCVSAERPVPIPEWVAERIRQG
jgi:tol-pal system-associated acyl-CoA thioesterase